MSDNTNPPAGGHHPGAAGGPQGPYGGTPQHNPYSAPQGQQPGQGQPPQGQQPQGPQYGQQPQGQQPQGPQYGQPQQPQYGAGQPQPGQYAPQGPQYQQSGQLWPQPGSPDYPQQGQGGGGQPPYGAPETMQWQPEPKKRGKLIPLVAGLAVVAVVAGGGVFAYARLTGGGQPAEVLPGNAVAYARIDLNPSAGQKVAAVRFMLKFPSAKEKIGLTSDKDDLRQKLFDLIKKDAGDDLAAVDFDKDIKPWLGDRAGVAAVPGKGGESGQEPEPIIAVEVKNEDKATAGLDKLFANEEDKPARAFKDGYVLIADEQSVLDAAVAGGKESSLAENATFKADMDALGEQGFVSLWADMKGLAALAPTEGLAGKTTLPQGSAAAALRFDAQYVELKGIARGDKSIKVNSANAGDQIAKLPDSTAGALTLSDGANLVDTIWKQLEKSGSDLNLPELTKDFTDEYGLVLPDDLKPLLGKNLSIAVDKDSSNGPKIAARIETDPAKAEAVVDKVTELITTRATLDIPIKKAKDDKHLVIATDQDYADQVLKGGNLGQSESFKQAVPDMSGAVMVGYVDFAAIASLDEEISSDKDFAALRSAGLTSRITGDGQGEFTLRVVAK
ncbi:DUF3352 domain-containing protein [Streptomyces sp. SID13031]|uniref:DUF3352 domain-containing protein n=1 Tax=Streptomyces sp. SID13031 TaxID=2706046 RepID=UPI0013C5BEF4|nr:DUF3352 domain-containing protein [Streptomyces sp. SID13031]NEA36779.1 DUF3352 domain-containing protein [Streptomyces sp. SID13031]